MPYYLDNLDHDDSVLKIDKKLILRDFQDVNLQKQERGHKGGKGNTNNNNNNGDMDDESEQIHDQLPSVEDVLMDHHDTIHSIRGGTGIRNVVSNGIRSIKAKIWNLQFQLSEWSSMDDDDDNNHNTIHDRNLNDHGNNKNNRHKFRLPPLNFYSQRRMVRIWSFAVIVLSISVIFAMILGLSIHLSVSDSRNTHNNKNDLTGGSGASTSTTGTSIYYGNDVGTYTTNMKDRVEKITTLLSGTVSDASDVATEGTPQYKAIHWLAAEDNYNIMIPTRIDKRLNHLKDNPTQAEIVIAQGEDEIIDDFLQRYAMGVLTFALSGLDILTMAPVKFLSDVHECRWHTPYQRPNDNYSTVRMGVTCNKYQKIEKLVLQTLNLNGHIPHEIGLLSNLQTLRLDSNNITSLLPNALKHCTNLQHFSATHNRIHGPLSDWLGTDLTMLQELQLSHNDFAGAIPKSFTQLTNMELLALDHNGLDGSFVGIMQELTSLQELYLSHNRFDEHFVTESFDTLSLLKVLDVSSNQILGNFPQNLFTLPNIRIIDVHDNALAGSLRDTIPEDCPIHYLDMKENFISGQIPTSIQNMQQLKHLDIATNRLDGKLPNSIRYLTDLQYFNIQDNAALSPDPVPHWLRFLTKLQVLNLMDTYRTGILPNAFEYLTDLRLLNLGYNEINGTIPSTLGNATDLQYLLLNRNQLTGQIPPELGQLDELQLLALDHNFITGTVPDDICTIPVLEVMVADCNDMSGACHNCFFNEAQVTCPCCTTCCTFNEEGCNAANVYMEDYSFNDEVPIFHTGAGGGGDDSSTSTTKYTRNGVMFTENAKFEPSG